MSLDTGKHLSKTDKRLPANMSRALTHIESFSIASKEEAD